MSAVVALGAAAGLWIGVAAALVLRTRPRAPERTPSPHWPEDAQADEVLTLGEFTELVDQVRHEVEASGKLDPGLKVLRGIRIRPASGELATLLDPHHKTRGAI